MSMGSVFSCTNGGLLVLVLGEKEMVCVCGGSVYDSLETAEIREIFKGLGDGEAKTLGGRSRLRARFDGQVLDMFNIWISGSE